MKKTTLTLLTAGLLAACTSSQQPGGFERADSNQDGKLSRKEASDATVKGIHRHFDTNQDGSLTLAEWKQNDDTADEALFQQRDTNCNGGISLQEAQASADRQHLFADVFKEADKDGDGLLTRDEAAAYQTAKETATR